MPNNQIQVDEIFNGALRRAPGEERERYLADSCGDDAELKKRVERLLRAVEEAGSFLESPAQDPSPTVAQPISEKPGTQIGPYKLLQQLGEGGMGVVYMAEQKEPIKRRVALKIIKPGMDTRQVIARFEAERQALAMMDHPSIAKVLDAGATESGRPYFVMELVNGLSVTKYCDEQHLTPKERLELFLPICQAVQHAHQKGIIHRDLKPSNILVALYDGQAVPKIIDFGVAKATSQTLTEKTMFTQLGQVVGTLEYMSPEQAERNQLDIDTRSDIYALGVVLYELLTGETPFDRERLRSAAFEEMLRIIREEEPSKPSTKVSSSQSLPTIAANRHMEPAKLGSMIRGELDWIVLKAMEKDRGRRYETASKFAEDVQNYLNDQAVIACPPSRAYEFCKFARRNKTAIGMAAVVSVLLVVGLAGTSWQAFRASKAERKAVVFATDAKEQADRASLEAKRANQEAIRASTEAAIAKAVNDFLNTDLLGMAAAEHQVVHEITPDPDLKLRTLLDRAALTLEERFQDQPLVEAAIRRTLGQAYYALGEYAESEKQRRRALELHKAVSGPESPETLQSMIQLAWSLGFREHPRDAEKLLRETLDICRRVLGPEHHVTLLAMNGLACCLDIQGNKRPEAEKLLREALEIRQRITGRRDSSLLNNLARVLTHRGRASEAEKLHREALKVLRQSQEPEHPLTLSGMDGLAHSLTAQGRYQEAETLRRTILEIFQRVLGPEHPRTLSAQINLALSVSKHDNVEAEDLLQMIIAINPDHLVAHRHLANLLRETGDIIAAIDAYSKCIELSPDGSGPHANYGLALAEVGRTAEAAVAFNNAVNYWGRLAKANPGKKIYRDNLLVSQANLAKCHLVLGNKQSHQEACQSLVALFPPVAERNVADWGHLGEAFYEAGQYPDAKVALEKTIELRGDEGPSLQGGPRWWYLALAQAKLGEKEQSLQIYQELVQQSSDNEKLPPQVEKLRLKAAKLLGLEVRD